MEWNQIVLYPISSNAATKINATANTAATKINAAATNISSGINCC